MRPAAWALAALLFWVFPGCAGGDEGDSSEHSPLAENGGHRHTAPHGGLLVELGEEEFAHVELLLEPEDGSLTAWLLDGGAERPVRSAQAELVVDLHCDGQELHLSLSAMASALTGESVGDTSEFHVADKRLGACTELEGRIQRVEALGSVFEDLVFEEEHGH